MSLIVTSPLRGWASAIDSVPDPVFAQRMMGDGVAIQPLDDTIVAPFDGEVTALHDSAHAIALRSPEGVELLIHIGQIGRASWRKERVSTCRSRWSQSHEKKKQTNNT